MTMRNEEFENMKRRSQKQSKLKFPNTQSTTSDRLLLEIHDAWRVVCGVGWWFYAGLLVAERQGRVCVCLSGKFVFLFDVSHVTCQCVLSAVWKIFMHLICRTLKCVKIVKFACQLSSCCDVCALIYVKWRLEVKCLVSVVVPCLMLEWVLV